MVVAAGQWKLMLPLLSGLNDELKAKIEELEKQGKFVCALASDVMDFIPAKLDVDTLFGSMSLIALLVFDVVIDEETETVISRFQKVGTEVLLNSRYSVMFGKQLAELYHIKLADESSNQAIGFSNPQYLESGPAVYDCAPQNVRAQASVVIAVGIKAQSVIYRIKCLFCGLRRCLNFLSIVGVAVVLASMLHFLMGYDVEKLIFPLIPLPLCLLIPAYYLMETTRNCAQYNRSYFLGSFCAFSTIATVCMGFETSGLCLSLSFVLLSAYLLVSAHAYRKINPKDIIALALLFAFTLIPWVLLGTSDWLPAAVLALFPAIGAFLLDLFY
ncbi:MAG: hypothetical protein IJN96_02510 [Clostridia bacterium]|nr:hypothetical protein [Clostridia bacterium]